MSSSDAIRAEGERWRQETWAPWIRENPERRDSFVNYLGISLEPVYTPADLEEQGFDYMKDLGFPGEWPYTRGIDPSGYRRKPLTVSVYAGYGTPEDTNLRYKRLIEFGAQGLSMAYDLPTQLGYDSDNIMSRGEVGRVGVSINTLRDMEVVFNGIPLDSIEHVGGTANAIGPIMLAMFIALGEKQGLEPRQFCVHLQNDVLKEYIARGTQIFPARPAARFSVDVLEWCARHAPHWTPLTICATHIVVAGAGSAHGTAFSLANAQCYVEEALRRGLAIDQVAPLLLLYPNEREDFFVAVAVCRALRRVWARLMRDRYGATDPRSLKARMMSYAQGPRATMQEPLNNIVRLTLAALALQFGGVQDLRSASFDEALNVPSEESVRTAVRSLQILGNEYGLTTTVDPLAGSYYVESLTSRMEKDILDSLEKVEALGGAIDAMERGYTQRIIADGAVRLQRAFERGERVTVGLNLYPSKTPLPEVMFQIDPDVEHKQIDRLQQVRRERDTERVRNALQEVAAAAREDRNTVPSILDAVRAYASVGEICAALKTVFGEYQPDRTF